MWRGGRTGIGTARFTVCAGGCVGRIGLCGFAAGLDARPGSRAVCSAVRAGAAARTGSAAALPTDEADGKVSGEQAIAS